MQSSPTPSTLPPDLIAAVAAARTLRVAAARQDVRAFVEYVLKDERGGSIELCPMHEEWLRIADTDERAVIFAAVGHGKTQLLSVGRTLFALGKNPNLRILLLSSSHGQAVKLVRQIADYLENSNELHEVFPALVRSRTGKAAWTANELTVKRTTKAKEPSITAAGKGGSINGGRWDWVIADDMTDYESTRTEAARADLVNWFSSTLETRLEPSGGKALFVGTPWHDDDLGHVLHRVNSWPLYKYAAIGDDGLPRFPSRWSLEKLADKRQKLGPYDAARFLDLEVFSDEESIIKRAWIDMALARGQGMTVVPQLLNVNAGDFCSIGVDVGGSVSARADSSAIVVVLVRADGTRRLLHVEAGKWMGLDLAKRVLEASQWYGNARVVVETSGQQEHVRSLVSQLGRINIEGHKTAGGKMSLPFLAEQLGAELCRDAWQIPSGHDGRTLDPQVTKLVTEMARFRVGDHCGDRLSALLMALTAAQRGARRAETGRLRFHR